MSSLTLEGLPEMARNSAKWLAFSVLLYVFFLHASTLYLFTRGFLLTRLSLSNVSSCSTCTLPPAHSRLILLIIDALRFDFLAPEPAITPSPHYHNVLTLPSLLTSQYPTHSFLFNTFADPPTATLQRIKGITTGSLPTFVDVGSNFGGSQITEDSIVRQMTQAGRKARNLTHLFAADTHA
jgi:GPI ethanolamine phosphate transferase 3 subunit O